MKCRKCNNKNPYQSLYCYYCGEPFSEQDKEKELNKGFTGIVKKLRQWYDNIHLSFITSSWIYKILSILLVLGIGIIGIYINGCQLKVNESDQYTFEYNKKYKEYYVYVDEENVKLNLYSMGNIDNIQVVYYNSDNDVISDNTYNSIDDVKLECNTISNNYYVLKANNKSIKVYVYDKEMKK